MVRGDTNHNDTNHNDTMTCPKIGLHKKCKIWKYKFSLFREEITV